MSVPSIAWRVENERLSVSGADRRAKHGDRQHTSGPNICVGQSCMSGLDIAKRTRRTTGRCSAYPRFNCDPDVRRPCYHVARCAVRFVSTAASQSTRVGRLHTIRAASTGHRMARA
eukprot:3940643-Rhodomonas_salina.4